MTLEDLKKLKEGASFSILSDEAQDLIETVSDELEGEEPSDETQVQESLREGIEKTFMFLHDAYNYLEEQHFSDFLEAIRDGAQTPQQIAYYYLEREIYDGVE